MNGTLLSSTTTKNMNAEETIAQATVLIQAPVDEVWQALVDSGRVKEYMFGTEMITDWKVGSDIVWRGEWKGKKYEDKGKILQLQPQELLEYTHFSPLTGAADRPENYHTVTIRLAEEPAGVRVTLSQNNNATEQERQHSEQNWMQMLEGLKRVVEGPRA